MKKIEIITDEHRHHVYVGNTDFWLNTQELLELYFKLGHVRCVGVGLEIDKMTYSHHLFGQ